MKFSNSDDFESLTSAWWRRVGELEALSADEGALKVLLGDKMLLDSSDVELEPEEWTLISSSIRAIIVRELKSLAEQLVGIGVEIDEYHGLPDDIAQLVGVKPDPTHTHLRAG